MAYFGIYQGTVMNAADPLMKGRVQVNIPSIAGNANAWALPCREPGSTATPRIGGSIWVMFKAGDASRPVRMGSLG